jgi:coenzyme PQQ biosynthesis protein PqqD
MGPARGLQKESAPGLVGESVLIRRTEVEGHTLPDQSCLLFDQRSRTSLPINESAGRIWHLCDGNHTLDQIVDDLASIYDAERAQIDNDVREFLAFLERHGFVERHSSFQ